VHHHLVRAGLRTTAGLVVETGSAREVHHFAVLAGYGAEAVHPYLAMETLADLHKTLPGALSADKAIYNYTKAIGKGLSKIMSKMGVSTYMSYCGAQLFEAIGLQKDFVDKYFRGTASQVGGIGVFEVAEEALRMHLAAFGNDPVLATMLDAGGEYAWRTRGEEHMWTPDAIAKLQHSARANQFDTYKEYAQIINDQSKRHMTLRGLFEFKVDPSQGRAAGRSGKRRRDRQALCHRRHEPGLDQHRSAQHAGHRHEPHRRQEQHRRRWRRPGALPQRTEGHPQVVPAPRCRT
jgi:glutamate synthase (NADPH/NADH) large chain